MAGIGKERLHLAWCSSSEGQRFAEIIADVTEKVKSQGKFDPAEFKLELDAAEMTVENETLRWLVGKELVLTSKGDIYGRKWEESRFEEILAAVLEDEYYKNIIELTLKEGISSVRGISERTGIEMLRISQLLSELEKTNRIVFKGHEDRVPVFAAL